MEEFLVLGSQVGQVCEEVKEFRFAKGKVCPHCNSELISRNGKYSGKQRYICKDCRKTFTDFTNSATYRSKKSLDKWLKYTKCMIMGLSISISKEQVCVATALDRQGNLIIEPLCKARMTHNELERLYKGRIGESSILCTDSHKSYIKFAIDFNLDHKRIKTGKHKEGIYHIEHINSLHSNFKKWMGRFNGVASKYISNYMQWFRWLRLFENDRDSIKTKNFIVQSNVVYSYTKIKDFKLRILEFM